LTRERGRAIEAFREARRREQLARHIQCRLVGIIAVRSVPVPNWQTIFFLRGTCQGLITPARDRSAGCAETLVHMIYRDGRTSYAFSEGREAMVSFSGIAETADDESGVLVLDHVSIATNPGPQVRSEDATGRCEFSNPFRGQSYVRCSARTASGEFTASFLSDGQPPARHDVGSP
jgi:hypothetical protein